MWSSKFYYRLPHLGMRRLHPRSFTVVRAYRATQKGSKGKDLDIYGKIFSFHAESVDLVLNTIAGHFSSHYHVIFENTFSTVEHMWKGTVPRNWNNLVEEHLELAT